MNFNDVRTLQITNGEVIKIEKDGTILWQKGGDWKKNQSYIYELIYTGEFKPTYNQWIWQANNGWSSSKFNYGNPPSNWNNTIPFAGFSPTPDGASGTTWGGNVDGIYSVKANKFKYSNPWIGLPFTKLRIKCNTNYTFQRSVDIRIYDSSNTILLGNRTFAMTGTLIIDILFTEEGKNYFNTNHEEGVEFIIRLNQPDEYNLLIMANGTSSHSKVFEFLE